MQDKGGGKIKSGKMKIKREMLSLPAISSHPNPPPPSTAAFTLALNVASTAGGSVVNPWLHYIDSRTVSTLRWPRVRTYMYLTLLFGYGAAEGYESF